MQTKEYPITSMNLWKRSYTYKDIGLIPRQLSNFSSRDEIYLQSDVPGLTRYNLPIMAAPMQKVIGVDMADVLARSGIPVVLPRSEKFEDDMKLWRELSGILPEECLDLIFFSVPAVSANERIHTILKQKIHPTKFCIDVANGFSKVVQKAFNQIGDMTGSYSVITGNIASVEGYEFLHQLGVDGVRCGIGGGSVCTTSLATGIGVGQASLIRELAEYRDKCHEETGERYPAIIADGGIKSPGDVVKALALGADIVMAGGMFAGTQEAPGDIMMIDGKKYKSYAGQASMAIKEKNRYIEGAEKLVQYKGPVTGVIQEYADGIKSAMSYLGYGSIDELKYLEDENFVLLSDAAQYERTPHAE